MRYTEKQLTDIESLATLYIKVSEMAVLIDVDESELRADINLPGHPARAAYLRGKLAQKLEVRKQMAQLARVGSPLALEQSEKALLDMEDDE